MYKSLRILLVAIAVAIIGSVNIFSNTVKEIQTLEEYSNELLEINSKKEENKVEKVEAKEVKKLIEEDTEKVIKKEEKVEKSIKDVQEKKESKVDTPTQQTKNKVDNTKVGVNTKKIEATTKVSSQNNKNKTNIVNSIDIEKKVATKKAREQKATEKKVVEKKEDLSLLEGPEVDEKEVTRTKYLHNGVEWELPDNFKSVLIGDLKGNVIFSKDADIKLPLASVTKVMALMVTFDEINAGRISLKDKVKIGKNPIRFGGSGIPLKVGQVFTLEDLIKASAIYSANNATYAIAEYVGKGSVNNFVKKMNKKIKDLGLSNEISYYTPAGLPTRLTKQPMDEGSARGIYKLSIEALKYKKYIEIAGIQSTTIHNGRIKIKNRNHLIGEQGIYGIKTGYHKEAKYNITVASKINGKDVIVVVMGGNTYKSRDGVVLEVLETYKKNYLNK